MEEQTATPPKARARIIVGDLYAHRRREFLRKAREVEASSSQLVSDFEAVLGNGNYVEPPHEPEALLEFAEFNPIHGACLEAKAVDSVGQGWTVTTKEDTDPDKIAELNETLTDELEALCPLYSFSEMLFSARWEAEAVGWSAWEVVRKAKDGKSPISAVYPIPAHELRAVPNNTNRQRVWAQVVDGQKRFFTAFGLDYPVDMDTGQPVDAGSDKRANEIIVFRRYSHASRYYGMPHWTSCIPSMAEYAAQREYNMSIFSSSGLADLLMLVKANDKKVAQEILDQIMAKIEEGRGEGHFKIGVAGTLDAEIEKIVLSESLGTGGTREGSFGDRREDLVKEILMAHNVPPYRVGWAQLGSLGGATAKEMLQAYRSGSIRPWQMLIEDTLRKTLFGESGLDLAKRGLGWTLVELDWEEEEKNAQREERLVKSGISSPNDARDALGRPRKPNPELDRHYINGQPLDRPDPPPPGTPGVRPPPPPGGGGAGPFDEGRAVVEKIDARREDYLPQVRKTFEGYFVRELASVMDAVERAATVATIQGLAEDAVDSMTPLLNAAIAQTYRDVSEDFAMSSLNRMAAAVQSSEPGTPTVFKARVPSEDIDFTDVVLGFLGSREVAIETVEVWREAVDRWVRTNGAEKVTFIQETTKGQIKDVVQEALASGASLQDTMERIDALYLEQIIPNRSEVIARTEIIPASNLGSQEAVRAAADAAAMDIEKQWISSGADGRTRPEHLGYDYMDVWVPLDKPYLVPFEGGIESLMFPGDSSLGASAGNTIQCRCSEVYRVSPKSSLDRT